MAEWCPDAARRSVLVVEDDVRRIADLLRVLGAAGYDLRVAESGEAALGTLAANPPDILLVDLDRPVLDGWFVLADAGHRPRRGRPSPWVLAVSRDEHARRRAFALGADDFVVGPVADPGCVVHVLDVAAAPRGAGDSPLVRLAFN